MKFSCNCDRWILSLCEKIFKAWNAFNSAQVSTLSATISVQSLASRAIYQSSTNAIRVLSAIESERGKQLGLLAANGSRRKATSFLSNCISQAAARGQIIEQAALFFVARKTGLGQAEWAYINTSANTWVVCFLLSPAFAQTSPLLRLS